MADDADTDDWPGYTPEEMDLPTELVERIRLVCSLLHLPVAERHSMPGVALGREEVWKPGELADLLAHPGRNEETSIRPHTALKALRRVSLDPSRITKIATAALVLRSAVCGS